MREIYEFRVPEKYANRLFGRNEGIRLGSTVRKVFLSGDDPRLPQIGELDKEITIQAKEPPRYFFAGWRIQRQYTNKEIGKAELLRLIIATTFEPAGEECGTQYDETTACPQCGAGALQVLDLYLDMRKVPKKKHIACTIADEIIVSQWLAEKMTNAGLTGFELRPVRHKARYEDDAIDLSKLKTGREILKKAQAAGSPHPAWQFWVWLNREENRKILDQAREEYIASKSKQDRRKRKPFPVWYQLVVTSSDAEIVPPTRVGINPFDDDADGQCRCSRGDLIGLNLLSEVSISAMSRGNADIVSTRQFVGARRGLLRPRRVILTSQNVRQLFESEKIRGVKFEIAHLI